MSLILVLKRWVGSKTYQMRLKADRVEAKKETVVVDNVNSMKEKIETKAELTVV